ncbi:unnamed protein product, partial [Brassica rapa subsp. trilocularis]
ATIYFVAIPRLRFYGLSLLSNLMDCHNSRCPVADTFPTGCHYTFALFSLVHCVFRPSSILTFVLPILYLFWVKTIYSVFKYKLS